MISLFVHVLYWRGSLLLTCTALWMLLGCFWVQPWDVESVGLLYCWCLSCFSKLFSGGSLHCSLMSCVIPNFLFFKCIFPLMFWKVETTCHIFQLCFIWSTLVKTNLAFKTWKVSCKNKVLKLLVMRSKPCGTQPCHQCTDACRHQVPGHQPSLWSPSASVPVGTWPYDPRIKVLALVPVGGEPGRLFILASRLA